MPLPAGADVWLVGEPDPLTEAVADRLRAAGFRVPVMDWAAAAATKPPAKPLAGLVLLAPLAPGAESGLNRQAFDWLKLASGKLRQTGRAGAAVFVTVARLDGAFGFADLSPESRPDKPAASPASPRPRGTSGRK